ncbi:hypothetical protein [Pseudomonas sp. 2023EL-01195]|uniref:hypothetical protein n=1 Tax=Pseudomonas sp. 2023EL-01195 TaxID=3088134 RepID=UPI00296AFAE3|nr:hypothetical protein [Pseudomonas sp. 2023EL-01195]MDW3711898.1 hypothetical protein [Pseudomonas sp. 2023EL-01195]
MSQASNDIRKWTIGGLVAAFAYFVLDKGADAVISNYVTKEVTDGIGTNAVTLITSSSVPNWIVLVVVVASFSALIWQQLKIRRLHAKEDSETTQFLQLRDKVKQLEGVLAKTEKAMREAELKAIEESVKPDEQAELKDEEVRVLLTLCSVRGLGKHCLVRDVQRLTGLDDLTVRARLISLKEKELARPLRTYSEGGQAWIPTDKGYTRAHELR